MSQAMLRGGRLAKIVVCLCVFISLQIATPAAANEPPVVWIASPVTGVTYAAGATVTFAARAWDSDGSITLIDLYVDSIWQARAWSDSNSVSLPNVPAGTFTLTARAWDNAGVSTTTATTLTVGSPSSPPSNQPPFVSVTAPANGETFTAPASMTVTATASDVDGSVAEVDFYANGKILGSDTSSPYSFSWTNVIAGDYSITAVARDDTGATTVSSTQDITIRPAGMPNTAVFEPSSNHETAVDRYVLEVFAAYADPTLANPITTRDLGKPSIQNGECTVDVTSTILALSPGTYIVTITAIGSGGSAKSAPSPQFSR